MQRPVGDWKMLFLPVRNQLDGPSAAQEATLVESLASLYSGRSHLLTTRKDWSKSELEAGDVRTTRLEDDVGERTAESGTQSLFQLAAAAEDGSDRLSTSLGIELAELREAVQTAVADT